MRKQNNTIRLTESDLTRVVNRVINEQFFNSDEMGDTTYNKPNRRERRLISDFKFAIERRLQSGGSSWSANVSDPTLQNLIDGVREVCDQFESRIR